MICQTAARTAVLTAVAALCAGIALLGGSEAGAAPANDNFPGQTITTLPVQQLVDTTGATSEQDEPVSSCADFPQATVWWNYTATETATLVARAQSDSDFMPVLTVWQPSSFPGGGITEAGCAGGWWFGPIGDAASVSFQADAGKTYHFQVGGFDFFDGGPVEGPVTFTLLKPAPPDNDDIADAISIGALPFAHDVEITGATVEQGEPSDCATGNHTTGYNLGTTVWYRFDATADETLVITTGGQYSYFVGTWYEGTPGDLEDITCGGLFTVTVEAGQTYYLQVGETYSLSFPLLGGAASITVEHLDVPECPPALLHIPDGERDAIITGPIPFSDDRPVADAEVLEISAGSNAEVACLTFEFAKDLPPVDEMSGVYVQLFIDRDQDIDTGYPLEPDPDPEAWCGASGPLGVELSGAIPLDPRVTVLELFDYGDFPFGGSAPPDYVFVDVEGSTFTLTIPLEQLHGDGDYSLFAVTIGDEGIDCLPDAGVITVGAMKKPKFGDLNCDQGLNIADATTLLHYVAVGSVETSPLCPTVGEPLPVVYAPGGDIYLAGDLDCDGQTTVLDVMVAIKDEAGLPYDHDGCPALGSQPSG